MNEVDGGGLAVGTGDSDNLQAIGRLVKEGVCEFGEGKSGPGALKYRYPSGHLRRGSRAEDSTGPCSNGIVNEHMPINVLAREGSIETSGSYQAGVIGDVGDYLVASDDQVRRIDGVGKR